METFIRIILIAGFGIIVYRLLIMLKNKKRNPIVTPIVTPKPNYPTDKITRGGSADILSPIDYTQNHYSICDGQSGPFTHYFKVNNISNPNEGDQVFTMSSLPAIPGNMTSDGTDFNVKGLRWVLIGSVIWEVTPSNGKLLRRYSSCN
jgi:hypothetical protein